MQLKNSSMVCVIALAFVGGASPSAFAADAAATAQARKSIQALYDRQTAAVAHKDVNAFFANVAPDAINYDTDGTSETAAQGRQTMTAIMGAMIQGDAKSVITSITLSSATSAVVMVKQHTHMVLTAPGKPTASVVQDDTARDNWVKTGAGWMLKQSQNLVNKMTINGKVVKK